MFEPSFSRDRLRCITSYACAYDPRFSYYVYIPRSFGTDSQPERYRLLVLVHGSERSAEGYRNKMKRFAEETQSAVLAPLFPAGILNPDDLDNYNMLRYRDIDYGQVLLHMLEEVGQRFPVENRSVFLHGFSAGAQFVHRFFYLHPETLRCVSIGSSSNVTLLNPEDPWPTGIRDCPEQFGKPVDVEALRSVPVQIVVGGEDRTPIRELHGCRDRLSLCGVLKENLEQAGVDVRLDVVGGAGHNGFLLLDVVSRFFLDHMALN